MNIHRVIRSGIVSHLRILDVFRLETVGVEGFEEPLAPCHSERWM